jgi:hypothetical protein
LSSEQRARALLTFDSAERHDWHYVPRRPHGLALTRPSVRQHWFFCASASAEAGASKALSIMHRETGFSIRRGGTAPARHLPAKLRLGLDTAFAILPIIR